MRNLSRDVLVRATFFLVAGLILWVGVLLLLWLALLVLGIRTNLWAMISALSSAAATAGLFVAAYFAYHELTAGTKMRRMEAADRLFNELNADECIAARRWIYQNLPEDPESGWAQISPEGFRAIKRTLNSLDRISFLQPVWEDDERVMPWLSTMVFKVWSKLGPYVEHERRRRNEPDYHQTAERLARCCIAWRKANGLSTTPTWVKEAL